MSMKALAKSMRMESERLVDYELDMTNIVDNLNNFYQKHISTNLINNQTINIEEINLIENNLNLELK